MEKYSTPLEAVASVMHSWDPREWEVLDHKLSDEFVYVRNTITGYSVATYPYNHPNDGEVYWLVMHEL
jgi:hypothetical protein